MPSFALLYSIDEVVDPAVTLKAIGHQWYWSYEYSDYSKSDEPAIAFDSYMIPEDDLELGQLRLLEVDNRIVLPVNTHVRLIITGADVLHSWAVPSLGIKCDAIPGRLNQIPLFIQVRIFNVEILNTFLSATFTLFMPFINSIELRSLRIILLVLIKSFNFIK